MTHHPIAQPSEGHCRHHEHARAEDQRRDDVQRLMTLLREQYRGWWVLVDRHWTRLIGASRDPGEAMRLANQADHEATVVVYRIPHEDEDLPFTPTTIGARVAEGMRGAETRPSD